MRKSLLKRVCLCVRERKKKKTVYVRERVCVSVTVSVFVCDGRRSIYVEDIMYKALGTS